MTTQTEWDSMTEQEKPLAIAGMMGWTLHKPGGVEQDWWDDHKSFHWNLPKWLTDYTACFEGPVAWAKGQGWEIAVYLNSDEPSVRVRSENRQVFVVGDSSNDICRAIWEAARADAESVSQALDIGG